MSEKRTDSNGYTIIFAVVMVVIVGALLAFVAASLRGQIEENEKYETQQNILYAMGVNNNEGPDLGTGSVAFIPTDLVQKEFDGFIKNQYLLKNGEMVEDPEAYLVDISKETDRPVEERNFPLFVGEKDGETFYVIPMRGKGLWDAIWGYMALRKDLTVQGAFFDHAGETPGLGANIKERYFMDDFHGESVIDDNNNFTGITIAKGNMDPLNKRKDDHKVDAIAGATITGDGVTAMINETLEFYEPYLIELTKEK